MIAGEPREQSIGHRLVVMGVDMVNNLLNRACALGYALHAAPQQLHKQSFQKSAGSFPVMDPPGGKFPQDPIQQFSACHAVLQKDVLIQDAQVLHKAAARRRQSVGSGKPDGRIGLFPAAVILCKIKVHADQIDPG